MIDFDAWAAHYGYDPGTDEARDDYAEYVRTAELLDAIFGEKADA